MNNAQKARRRQEVFIASHDKDRKQIECLIPPAVPIQYEFDELPPVNMLVDNLRKKLVDRHSPGCATRIPQDLL